MDQELLLWIRGTGLQIASAVFVLGMSYRMLHLLMLGRKKSLAEPAARNGRADCARCGSAASCCRG